MIGNSRNLCLYPNVYLMDQFSSQIRIVRPISVNKTEVTIYCIAPKGESAEARARRIRQYEDFFNATGMATPDDLEEFRSCQKSYGHAPRLERHEPRRRRTGSRAGDDAAKDRTSTRSQRRADRRRGPVSDRSTGTGSDDACAKRR